MLYVSFKRNEQAVFLRKIKNATKLTWKQLALKLGVDRSMVFFYLSEHSKLPYNHYKKLSRSAALPIKKQELVEINNKARTLSIPILSNRLAEFLGALAGDGHMNKVTYEVSITLNAQSDKVYLKHIKKLIESLFDTKARSYTQTEYNKTKCYFYSKKLVWHLNNKYNVPIGKKKGNLHIPLQVFRNESFLKAYIRGLFDTDGSIHRHHKKDIMTGIASGDRNFLSEIEQSMTKLGITSYKGTRNVYIYSKKDIKKFFSEVKPNNQKHLEKYRLFLRKGALPTYR